jgi:hypothetical protein
VDPEITSLAQGAGATLVALMATDAWQAAREGIIRLWRRMQPHRADTVAAELEAGQVKVLAAVAVDDQVALSELRAEWQGRFRRLLVTRPEAATELRRLLDELAPADPVATHTVTQHATATGHARIYQAGRDQHIAER